MSALTVGVLLAAGIGYRYDPSGQKLKLLEATLDGPHRGLPIVVAAARNLRAVMPRVVAVVRPDDNSPLQRRLRQLLVDEGCELMICSDAVKGMGASIACAVTMTPDADGWIIALADMPMVEVATIAAVKAALEHHVTVAPFVRGQRGHPVGFAASLRAELAALGGDQGARSILQTHPPYRLHVDDEGALYDVDTPA